MAKAHYEMPKKKGKALTWWVKITEIFGEEPSKLRYAPAETGLEVNMGFGKGVWNASVNGKEYKFSPDDISLSVRRFRLRLKL